MNRARRLARELAGITVAAAVVLVARTSLADHYVVPSGSMEPTVRVGDRIVVDRLAFGLRLPLGEGYVRAGDDPRPGDVVVLASPEDHRTLLKRVVAVPGDTVRVVDGIVQRNERPARVEVDGGAAREWLDETSHAILLDDGGGPNFGPITLPPGMFLVLGDHRGNSHDGRAFGLVARDAIHGRARAVFVREGRATWEKL